MARIAGEVIEQVREATDIVALISEYVPLKKAGRRYRALCPFHTEKTPSFFVDPERQLYHCFGCQAGGNAFSFLMEHEKLSFIEAVRMLAQRAGIDLPERRVSEAGERFDALYEANAHAAEFYHRLLLRSEGEAARRYLLDRRFTEQTLKEFQLGYAPGSWDRLLRSARRSGIKTEALERAGLVILSEKGTRYDRFRHRILFPIASLTGRVVGFGGRALGEEEVKYINSPDTAIYQKGRVLFGLCQAKGEIRRTGRALVVEGYTDLLRLVQHGIRNVVATSGTALTREQGYLLARYAGEAVLVFDGDEAGSAAALRGSEELLAAGIEVRIARVPAGLDPDVWLEEIGQQEFLEKIADARSAFDLKIEAAREGRALSDPDTKVVVIRAMAPLLASMRDDVRRRVYAHELATRLHVDESRIWEAMARSSVSGEGEEHPHPRQHSAQEEAEIQVLGLALADREAMEHISRSLRASDFVPGVRRRLIETVLDAWEQGEWLDAPRLLDRADDEEWGRVISDAVFAAETVSEPVTAGGQGVAALKRFQFERMIKGVKAKIEEAERGGDERLLSALLKELQELVKRRNVIVSEGERAMSPPEGGSQGSVRGAS